MTGSRHIESRGFYLIKILIVKLIVNVFICDFENQINSFAFDTNR